MDTYLMLYLHGEGSHSLEHQSDVVTVLHPPTVTCEILLYYWANNLDSYYVVKLRTPI